MHSFVTLYGFFIVIFHRWLLLMSAKVFDLGFVLIQKENKGTKQIFSKIKAPNYSVEFFNALLVTLVIYHGCSIFLSAPDNFTQEALDFRAGWHCPSICHSEMAFFAFIPR